MTQILRRLAFPLALALVLFLLPSNASVAHADDACRSVFQPSPDASLPAVDQQTPCPELLLAIPFRRQPPAGFDVRVIDTRFYRDAEDRPNAFVSFRFIERGQGGHEERRMCPSSTSAFDMQINFIRFPEDGSWVDLDSRGSPDPAECGAWTYWSAGDIDDLMHPPRFAAVKYGDRQGVHDVGKGSAERKAILDAVREANADLNDRVPIVFIVEHLRADDRFAYFQGLVRRKADCLPLDLAVWGPCEQEPETAIVEALLERAGGRWRVVKFNRCADDVLLTETERRQLRLFLMEN